MSGIPFKGLLFGLLELLSVYRGRGFRGHDSSGAGPSVAVVLGTQVLAGGRPSRTLEARVLHAARMYAAGGIDRLVVTGGLGKHPPTEAEVMARILGQDGVPDEAVEIEDKAESTWDSARLLADVLAGHGVREVLVVTDPLHCVRTAAAFERVGICARPEPVYSSPMWRDPWLRRGQFFRESGALVWYAMRYGVGGRSGR
ncbi:YdcF family protein [Rubrobacter tropicus]|uniref:YdcF family protein n=1 Tax=Rubrobacter tropicus TaxID=2653851 RepID=UPI00140BA304|nr:YdcF family protein [Rubrobacter tropicus]